jgi:hypothetical protein
MISSKQSRLVFFSVLLSGSGCAALDPVMQGTRSGKLVELVTACAPSIYDEARVERIVSMRENGDSLAEVAREVGGTRQDVKLVERSIKTDHSVCASLGHSDNGLRPERAFK